MPLPQPLRSIWHQELRTLPEEETSEQKRVSAGDGRSLSHGPFRSCPLQSSYYQPPRPGINQEHAKDGARQDLRK